ncbi:Gfo/Idh/MocA family oxidoreductase [Microbacterium capsulatum]|uniref:Gfo/Idh/MocA family oxidoreductase n=1 Tax=Microbacterium capsulatum TaxID=3041921 RepID=A0ABU0XF22_9MICO|nr:Gfo/Idh/MocA family oxidoreductase [Microbacterium sp. ASV81]MDQ4213713.1 Gfo/Idh/MocA family oxidoreductase [Microbacterium sp. ASV81]
MKPARTMVFGPSHWHVPLCAERIGVRHDVIGVSDEDAGSARRYADLWDAPVYGRWQDLLAAHPDAELAYVFVPHDQMREACLALIDARIPFVVEKPAGVSRSEVADVRAAAESAGVPIAVTFVQRGGPTEQWLSQAGPAVYESTQFIAGPPDRYLSNGSPWMVERSRSGGGCVINLAPHFIDMFLRSAGQREATVSAALSSALHGRGVEDFGSLTLTTSDGRICTIQVGYAFPGSALKRHCSFTRIGPNGVASIWTDGTASFTATDGATATRTIDVDSDPLYDRFVDAVADTLDQGFEGLPGIRDLEDAMAIVWDAYSEGNLTP